MADVLSFVTCVEPVDLEGWWNDTLDGPSHVCGFQYTLRALEASLRSAGEQQPAEGSSGGIDWEACGAKGSIAHALSQRRGGVEGAFERIKAAEAAGIDKWAALRQELGIEAAEARTSKAPDATPASQSADLVPAIPVSLFEDDLHERLMNASGIIGTVCNALDEDCAEEHDALSVAVSMLHKIDDDLDRACWQAIEAFDRAHPDHPDATKRRRVLDGMRPTEESAS